MSQINQHYSRWQLQLQAELENNGLTCFFESEQHFEILSIDGQAFYIHLVPLQNKFTPSELITLQQRYQFNDKKCVHLWEDVWLSRPTQVVARIKSLLGNNIRIHGRKTKIARLNKPSADAFLEENHLQGSVSSRYKLGLFEKDHLVAVATFSALRNMKHSDNYRSAELIRFAVKAGYSVTGGLSKLISHFIAQYHPNDIMSYADRDWSAGEAYSRLGFKLVDAIDAQYFCVDSSLKRTLNKAAHPCSKPTFNTGSLKFILQQ